MLRDTAESNIGNIIQIFKWLKVLWEYGNCVTYFRVYVMVLKINY